MWVELVCFSRQVSTMGIVGTPYLCVMNHVINELPIALLCGKFLIAYLREVNDHGRKYGEKIATRTRNSPNGVGPVFAILSMIFRNRFCYQEFW